MNLKYKLGATALALIAMTSCETNDPFSDIMDAGQPVPTVSWSVGSTVAAAGDSIEISGNWFKGYFILFDIDRLYDIRKKLSRYS